METNATAVSILLVVLMVGIGPAVATGTTAQTLSDTAAASSSISSTSSAAISTGPAIAQTATQGNCSFPVTRTDATGTTVTIESEPQRIVTLAPSAAQTLWEIGAREKVVGVTQYADYLEGAERLANISGAGRQPNIEEIVGLEPDLVIAPNVISNQTVKKLRSAGLTVFKFEAAGSIKDVYQKTRLIGRLVGTCEGADRIVTAMKERVSTIRTAVADKPTPSVLYYLGGSFVAGNNTFIGGVIETAGGENLAANAGIEGFAKISNEVVVKRNPAWVVVTSRAAIPNGTPWTSTTALQQNQTIVVNNDYINQPAPRVVLPLTKIAKALHPEAIQSANISETPIGPANITLEKATTEQPMATDGGTATTATTAGDGTSEPTEMTAPSGEGETTTGGKADQAGPNGTETTSGNGAGFGIAVAAIAVLGTALLARQRR